MNVLKIHSCVVHVSRNAISREIVQPAIVAARSAATVTTAIAAATVTISDVVCESVCVYFAMMSNNYPCLKRASSKAPNC
jgi:hypothetical protein